MTLWQQGDGLGHGRANLEVGDVELVVDGEVVVTSGCHQLVPSLLAGLLAGGRDQPKLSHGDGHQAERKDRLRNTARNGTLL